MNGHDYPEALRAPDDHAEEWRAQIAADETERRYFEQWLDRKPIINDNEDANGTLRTR